MKNARVRSTVLSISFLTAAVSFWKPPSAFGQAPYYFTGLGDLPGGSFGSYAYGVTSGTNPVVVGDGTSAGGNEAFIWTIGGGMQGLGFLSGGSSSAARSVTITSEGTTVVVGDSGSTPGVQTFRWTQSGGMVGLGDLTGDPFRSYGKAVSTDGSVVAGTGNIGGTTEAFRWTQSDGMVGLGDLSGGNDWSEGKALSGNGLVVVGQGSPSVDFYRPVRWTQTTGMVDLGDLPGGGSGGIAYGVNFDGSVVVGNADDNPGPPYQRQAFRWTEAGGMVGLGDLAGGAFDSIAYGVSSNGTWVVGEGTTGLAAQSDHSGNEAFIWDPVNGIRNLKTVLTNDFQLDLTGWTLRAATGISPDGQNIVGWGINPSGQTEAWLAHIPEPSTSALLLAGGFALLARLGRRQR